MEPMSLSVPQTTDSKEPRRDVVAPGTLYEVLPDGRWAFYFDSHMIGTFSDCETKFKLAYRDNLRLRGERNFSTSVGSWWSAAMSDFYEFMAAGSLTLARALESAGHHWAKLKMQDFQATSPKKYEAFGGYNGALLMVSQYYTAQADTDQQGWKIIATEAGFGRKKEVLVGENHQVVVYLIGVPDLIIFAQNRLMPVDHKTRDRIDYDVQSRWKPHSQTAGYIYATNILAKELGYDVVVDRCIINVAARLEPTDKPRDGVKKPRFTRAYPNYSQEELAEWRQQKMEQATRLRYCIESDMFTRNEYTCHLYSGCAYRPVCSVKPSSRSVVIKANYEVVKAWVPYELGDE